MQIHQIISTIFSQQISNDILLLAITNESKNNISYGLKLDPITTQYLKLIVKIL